MPPPHPTLGAFARGCADGSRIDAEVVTSAVEHRMSGLVLAAVRDGVLDADQDATRMLGIHQLSLKRRHDRLARGVDAVADILEPRAVDWMVIKGLGTEARWYEARGDRPATDIDILIRKTSGEQVAEVTRALDPAFSPVETAAEAVASGHLQHLELTVEGVPVDLHTDFLKVGVRTRQHKHLWSTAGQVMGTRATYKVPSAEWTLIGQLLHLTKDGFSHLGSFLEIQRIASTPSLDWELVQALVAGEGLEVPFWSGLDRVHGILGIPPVGQDVRGWRSRVWDTTWPERSVLRGREGRAEAPSRQMWLAATLTGRRSERARELKRQFVPSRALFSVAEGHQVAAADYLRRLTIDRAKRVVTSHRGSGAG